jgi:hypothetical protein
MGDIALGLEVGERDDRKLIGVEFVEEKSSCTLSSLGKLWYCCS